MNFYSTPQPNTTPIIVEVYVSDFDDGFNEAVFMFPNCEMHYDNLSGEEPDQIIEAIYELHGKGEFEESQNSGAETYVFELHYSKTLS